MSKKITASIRKEFDKLNLAALGLFSFVFIAQGLIIFVAITQSKPGHDYFLELGVASGIMLVTGIATFALIKIFGNRIYKQTERLLNEELRYLRAADNRAKSLQEMASKMRATLSFEVVVEEALDVCSLALEEEGIPRQSLAGAVFLYNGSNLYPVATRRFIANDLNQEIAGNEGIVGKSLARAEIVVANNPRKDPELSQYMVFQKSLTAVCIPLRAGFQILGAMVISSDVAIRFNRGHFDLFSAVSDQAVIALQNAQLFQKLNAEKQRLIDADEAARKELARDLHDGPTQTIAAIAMRINYIRSLVTKNPDQAVQELQKVEALTKQTSKDIRGMLFTLRPLVLEAQGLTAAIESVMKRLRENNGLNLRLLGGKNGDLLDDNAQSIVFSIVEEALGNARKHAKAEMIEVRFWQEDGLFVAQVHDNGVGFETEAVNRNYSSRGSLGMVNMRERAERIDGSLRLESQPGEGTTMTLVVPLSKHGRDV